MSRKRCRVFPELAPKLVSPLKLSSSFPAVVAECTDAVTDTIQEGWQTLHKPASDWHASNVRRKKLPRKLLLQVSSILANWIKSFLFEA